MSGTRAQVTVVALLIALAVLGNALRATEPAGPGELGLGAALSGVPATHTDESLDPGFFEVLGAREVLYRTYEPDSPAPVWVFAGYFDRQREGSQVHSPRHCYPGAGWNIERETRWPAPWGTDELRALVVHNGVERRLVCYWYQTRERVVADEFTLKLVLAARAVRRRPQDVVFASVSTPFESEIQAAKRRVGPYAGALKADVDRLFRARDEPDRIDQ